MAKPKNAAGEDQAALNQERWLTYVKRPTPELREALILQYTPLVKFVIGRMAIGLPAIMDYDDVFSVGIVGLIEALERYDPTKGVKFETYAISRIRGSIIDSLRKADRLSRTARQNMRQVEEATEALRVKLGREPSNREVAATIGVSPDRLKRIVSDASWVTVSLDGLLDGSASGDGYPAAEMPRDPSKQDVPRQLEHREEVGALAGAILELPERERLVVSLYYQDELSQREIAKVLGVSESRVCQLHARALERLRGSMAERTTESVA